MKLVIQVCQRSLLTSVPHCWLLVALLSVTFAIAAAQAQQAGSEPPPTSSTPAASTQDQKEEQKPDQKQDPKPDPSPQPAPAATNGSPVQANSPQSSGQGKIEGTSNDRLFYTLPNFLTLQSGRLPPMPVKDKFKAVAVGNFDFIEFPWWGVIAAIDQANNSDPAFGQGWLAYAKRYGVTMADSSIENFMVGAVFSSMLRQDPRFYQSGKGTFWRRTGHALKRMVVTYSDSGKTQFNYSEIVGAATAGAISTYSYHPRSVGTPSSPHFIPSERTLSNALSTWGTQLYLDALTLEIKEFWPDIHRKLSGKHKKQGAEGTPQSAPQ